MYSYFVLANEHTPQSIEICLRESMLSGVWVRLRRITPAAGPELLMLELFEVESGAPVDVEGLGQRLSAEGRTALFAAVDPTDRGAAFELCRAGEQQHVWSGELESFDLTVEGEQHLGREGFLQAFAALTGVAWDALVEAASAAPREAEVANGQANLLLLRGRVLLIPEGMPMRPELFRLHYAEEEWETAPANGVMGEDSEEEYDDQDEEDEADEASPDESRLMLVLLDARLCRHLWEEAPASGVASFLKAVEPARAAVLGPLAHTLPDVIGIVEAQPPDRALAGSQARELLVYEVVSMATAVGFVAGDTVAFYDELLFPLLNLTEQPVSPEAVRASLEEIQGMGVLSAMVEVLPYAAPEGELLESFADDELAPLAEWAAEDDLYEGSLFLLDARRLWERVLAFDLERLMARVQRFREIWADVVPDEVKEVGWDEELDELELFRVGRRLEELQLLLALAQANDLQPAILFYGD
jgi:hypothetical protein